MNEPRRITLLTQEECQLCDHAKEVLTRVARDHLIEVDEISLDSKTGRALAIKFGMSFAPGVLVDGEPFAFGRLSERKLRRTLTVARP